MMESQLSQWQQAAPVLVFWGGFLLVFLGAIKMTVYLIGEFYPGAFARIRSGGLRKFLTGTGNRLVFGLGGFLTAGLGAVFMILAKALQIFMQRFL